MLKYIPRWDRETQIDDASLEGLGGINTGNE